MQSRKKENAKDAFAIAPKNKKKELVQNDSNKTNIIENAQHFAMPVRKSGKQDERSQLAN